MSVRALFVEVLAAHQSEVSRLEVEEAAILARCDLLEELLATATPRVTRGVDSERAAASVCLPKRPRVEDEGRQDEGQPEIAGGPSQTEVARRLSTAGNGRSNVTIDLSDKKAKLAGDSPKQPTAAMPHVVNVDDDDDRCRSEAQCTPSEILDECDALFGGASTTTKAALVAPQKPAAVEAPVGGGSTKESGHVAVQSDSLRTLRAGKGIGSLVVKTALKKAMDYRKERHPKALVVMESGALVAARGRPSGPSHGHPAAYAVGQDEDGDDRELLPPQQTPDAFWDVTL
jgi:hypothetical protein